MAKKQRIYAVEETLWKNRTKIRVQEATIMIIFKYHSETKVTQKVFSRMFAFYHHGKIRLRTLRLEYWILDIRISI
jgi:hypothetical protein